MFKKIVVLGAMVAAFAALMATPASAQFDPCETGYECTGTFSAQIDDLVLTVGEPFTVSGQISTDPQTQRAGDPSVVDVAFDATALGSITVNDDGSYAGTFTTPNVALGAHTVNVDYLGSVAGIEVTVVAGGGNGPGVSGGSTDDGTLARTGSTGTGLLVKLGGGLLLAGAGATLLTTKRRHTAAA